MGAVPRIDWPRQWVPERLRRRLVAAALAGGAVILALASVHHGAAPVAALPPTKPAGLVAGLAAGQVAAPVRLADPAIGQLLHPGDRVDVLAATGSPTGAADAPQTPAAVLAHGVRVLTVPATSPTAGAAGTLVVLSVSSAQAQSLAGAEASGRLSVVLVADS